jgi:hypothetical protein
VNLEVYLEMVQAELGGRDRAKLEMPIEGYERANLEV